MGVLVVTGEVCWWWLGWTLWWLEGCAGGGWRDVLVVTGEVGVLVVTGATVLLTATSRKAERWKA
jgi:hypothetical protein